MLNFVCVCVCVCVCVFIGHTVSYDAIYAPDFGLVRQLGGMTCIQVFSMRLFVQDPCTLASASIPCPALILLPLLMAVLWALC